MAETRGKLRSRSQRIGDVGESIFKTWAHENRLIPQKVDHDYGVDFFSQVCAPTAHDAEDVTGAVLAAQVRSVRGGARRRINLDRVDVTNALRIDVPFCLFAVDTERRAVSYLFLDDPLIRRFQEFLHSSDKTTSLRTEQFRDDAAEFAGAVAQASRSGYQQRLRILKTELGLARVIPDSRLSIVHRSGGGLALLEVPWITEVFDVPDDRHDAIATLVFEEGRLPRPGEEGVRLHEELHQLGELVEGPVILSGAFESRIELAITVGINTLTHPFMVRRIGDELAYVDPPSGLALVFSAPRRRGDTYVHEMSARLSSVHAQPIETLFGKEFLRYLRPGAILDKAGQHGMPVSMWPSVQKIGPAIDAIDLVHKRLGLDTSRILLADLKDVEFGMALTLLEFMISGFDIRHILPGFVFGPAAHSPDPSCWQPAEFRVPLVVNFKDTGLVLWIEGLGDAYVSDDLICGFRVRQQARWECDVRDKRFTKGTNPEAWIAKDWPPIPLFSESASSLMTFTAPSNHPVVGDIHLLARDPLIRQFPDIRG